MNLHATGQALDHRWQRHQIGRASQQKTPWAPVLINGQLDRHQQFRGALDFVNDDALLAADKAHRVSPHGG